MYSLLFLLALIAATCWVRALAAGSRAHTLGFSLAYAAMLYTHNWALFFGAAMAVAGVVLLAAAPPDQSSRLLRTGLLGYGLALVLYLPWVPSLLYQSAHTGTPWASAPALYTLLVAPARLLGAVTLPLLRLAVLSPGAGRHRPSSRSRSSRPSPSPSRG